MASIVLILGASKGLGAALYEDYKAAGWQVLPLARSTPFPESISCDLANFEETQTVLKDALQALSEKQWEAIHLVFNAARLGEIGPVSQGESSDWLQSIALNYSAFVLSAGLFAQYFQSQPIEKVIAAVSSGAAQKNYASWALYCSTKAGMERFSTCLAEEQKFEQAPLKSIVINPGVMDTQMQEQIRGSEPEDFPYLQRFLDLKASNSLPSPEAVAQKIGGYLREKAVNGDYFKVTF